MIVIIIDLLLPIRLFINRYCTREDEIKSGNYKENYLEFQSDYDRENPLTQKEGMIKLIEARRVNFQQNCINEMD
jgi:hypothetical protein